MVRLLTPVIFHFFLFSFYGLNAVENQSPELFAALSNSRSVFPAYQELVSTYRPSDTILLDREGRKIQTIRRDFKKRRIEWWEANQVSPFMLEALIAAEDRLFYEHEGVDGLAVSKAFWGFITGSSYRGASTISMQVAGMISPRLRDDGKRRSVSTKIRQMNGSTNLELEWTKQEILTYYINHISMRGEIVGIPAASFAHFGVPPSDLNPFQSMVLASLVRSPNAGLSTLKFRVKNLAIRLGWEFSEADWTSWIESKWFDPSLPGWTRDEAFHFTMSMHPNHQGFIRSTLESSLQIKVNSILKSNILQLRDKNVRDGGVVVLDNTTGDILAYSGGIPKVSNSEFIDSNMALRQAGSTLKPFLYSLAIEKKYLTATSILSDSPLNLDLAQGVYRPSNYDKQFHGDVSVKVALGSSLNIPAVRTILLTGVPEFHTFLRDLGMKSLRESDYYGYSLALGTADIRLLELTKAYSILARMGRATDDTQLLSSGSSYIITKILADREARSIGFGLENNLSTRFFSAVKTGTSQDMRDNWCVGYNRKYTVGVWMGNLQGDSMKDVTGITGAAPVWREVMEYLYSQSVGKGVDHSEWDLLGNIPGNLTRIDGEYYLNGTEPNPGGGMQGVLGDNSILKIHYPTQGMVFTVDPDIPPRKQKIIFQASKPSRELFWYLNKKKLGRIDTDFPWIPIPGIYRLQVIDSGGKVIDSVSFTVR